MLGEIFDAVAACGMAALPRLATSNVALPFEDADPRGEPPPLIFATTLFLDAEDAPSSLRPPAMPLWCDLPSPCPFASFFTALLDDDDDDDDDDDVLDNVDIPFFLWHTPLDDVDAMAFDDSLSNSITAPAARWFVAQRRIVVFFSLFHPSFFVLRSDDDVRSRADSQRGDWIFFCGLFAPFLGGDASPPRLLSFLRLSFPECRGEKVKNLLEKGEGEDATSSMGLFFLLAVCPLISKLCVFFISKNLFSFSFFLGETSDDDDQFFFSFFFCGPRTTTTTTTRTPRDGFVLRDDFDDSKKRRKNENDDDDD